MNTECHENYLDFYHREYGIFIVSSRLIDKPQGAGKLIVSGHRACILMLLPAAMTISSSLLKHSKMSLEEIAYATGFSSQAHITSLFSKRMSITATGYRRLFSFDLLD